MESRKRLFKAGPRDNPTLTDRVQRNKVQRKNARDDKFDASRKIPIADSPTTPGPAGKTVKVSEITDRNEKLKAYRIAKNTKKFQEIQKQRSPFVLAVPTGRWVEKKERTRTVRMDMQNTPVKAALMNERVLKKSTVKNLIAKSTTKKENLMPFENKNNVNVPVRSKKKILEELNAVVSNVELEVYPLDLDNTFEIESEEYEDKSTDPVAVETLPSQRLSRSKTEEKIVEKKPVEKIEKLKTLKTSTLKRQVTAVIKKPVVVKKPAPAPVKQEVPIKRLAIKKTLTALKSTVEVVQQVQEAAEIPPPKPAAKKIEPQRSMTYSLYNSSLNTQINFLTMELNNLTSNKNSFYELLSEDQQLSIDEAIQQGNLLINEKLGKFGEFLNKFEDGQDQPEDPKRITDDDVENYWYLIYDEIEKLKGDLGKIQAMKKNALGILASAKKRRTRRTYIPEDGTPKRSQRIAVNVDTPKHNASCYGCVTMSASKINTPKSATKRRTTGKKSVAFDNVETPKRAESNRRTTKRHKPTPKRNLMRMNAVDGDASDSDLELV